MSNCLGLARHYYLLTDRFVYSITRYLVHGPYFNESPSELQQIWAAMESIKESGKARSIGVSNYEESHILTTLETARIPPAVNQIEFHPYLQHGNLLPISRQRAGVVTSAYGALAPLTRNIPGPLDDTLKALSEKYGVSPALICLRWCIEQDVVVITTSRNHERIDEYKKVFDFQLTEGEVGAISAKGTECVKEAYVPRIIRYVRGLKQKDSEEGNASNSK